MNNKFNILNIFNTKGLHGSAFRNRKTTTGFTVLFAVIVASLVLALGLGIVAITMKEVKLSGTGRDSQLAFYAADSGSECAEYYDVIQSAFSTSTSASTIKCNGQDIPITFVSDGVSSTSSFKMYMEYSRQAGLMTKPCADVAISKSISSTVIDSRGYNTCDIGNLRRLERGYRVQYTNNP